MKEPFKWFSDYWGAIPIIVALVLLAAAMFQEPVSFENMAWFGLVALTAVTASVTMKIARENRRTTEEMKQSRLDAVKPSLSLQPGDFSIGGGVGGLYLANSGGVAKDVKIDIETARPGPKRLFVSAIDRGHRVYLGDPAAGQDQTGVIAVNLRFRDGYDQPLSALLSMDFANLKQEGREIKGQYSDSNQIKRTLEMLTSEIRRKGL